MGWLKPQAKFSVRQPMSTRLVLAIGILILPVLAIQAQWRSDPPLPEISVSGSAEVKVAPDEVDLNVGVEIRDENLESAKRKNDKSVSDALEFLKHNGVKDKDVQTDYIAIEPEYDPNARSDADIDPRTGLPLPFHNHKYQAPTKPDFYVVRRSIGIKVTDVSNFDSILTGLITNGVNSVQGIEFRTTELRKYKDQAREMAIKAAKEKAGAMASALEVKVGKLYYISINDWGGSSSWSRGGWGYTGGGGGANTYQNNAVVDANSATGVNGATFAVGQISVSAQVNVTFLIQ